MSKEYILQSVITIFFLTEQTGLIVRSLFICTAKIPHCTVLVLI